jgi:hypothetical protein
MRLDPRSGTERRRNGETVERPGQQASYNHAVWAEPEHSRAASGNVCVLDHLRQHSILRVPVAPGDVAPDQEGLGLVAVVVRAVETEVAQRGELASMRLSQLAECGSGGYLRA